MGDRLTVVGGGSTYTPELVDGLARRADVLDLDELVLVDPDRDRLAVVGGMAERMLRRAGFAGRLVTTGDLDAGLDGASTVLVQLRVGGQAARAIDEELPHACGCIGQETTGAGGFAKALRTVPVLLDIAERLAARAAPGCWLVDFTNPVGIVTRALLDEGHHAVGLCNVAIGFERLFAGWLGVERTSVQLDHVGLNHLTWIRRVLVDGVDRMGELVDGHAAEIERRIALPRSVIDDLGAIPSYYLSYFYRHDAVLAEQLTAPSRAADVTRIEAELLSLYADPTVDTKPPLLEQRGGAFYSEAAVQLITSLRAGDGSVQVVNVRNGTALPELPPEAVVEIPCRIGPDGPVPLPVAPLAPELLGLVQHVTAYETLTIEAATSGSRRTARRGLVGPPPRRSGRGGGRPGGPPARRPCRAPPPVLPVVTGTTTAAGPVVGVDGGNSKTEVVVVATDGTVLARRRGPGSSPFYLGFDGSAALLADLVTTALAEAGAAQPPAVVSVCLAGLDLPGDEELAIAALATVLPETRVVVRNDIFAVLRAGLAARSHGVAVVCGAGINAIGVGPAGVARFLSLGPTSGDWGGGFDLGLHALGAAVRAADGRGRPTSLGPALAAHFECLDAVAVAIAIHRGEIDSYRLVELGPLVVEHARGGDAAAIALVERCADEVAAFVAAAATRSGLTDPFDVVLGGSVLTGDASVVGERATQRILATRPHARVVPLDAAPVVGAALLGFDELGRHGAEARLRASRHR